MACMRALLLAVVVAGCGSVEPLCDDQEVRCNGRCVEWCNYGTWETQRCVTECGKSLIVQGTHGTTCTLESLECAAP